jgi:SAM-dependent methyltransferase
MSEKFLTPEELKRKTQEWRINTKKKEIPEVRYKYDRMSEGGLDEHSISQLHETSFINDVIPKLIERKKKGEKVKVLDVGGGAGFFTDEIRKRFGEKVEVFSTGLSKRAAEDYREKTIGEKNKNLHPNDIKWRSILELSDFEEFDLIIDTLGEFYYTLQEDGLQENKDRLRQKAVDYLTAVIKKLKPEGLASIIATSGISFRAEGGMGKEIIKELEKEYKVKIYTLVDTPCLKIEKL